MNIHDLHVYQLAMEIADDIWYLVEKWESFSKWTIGRQLVEAADSMAANISEGFGRFSFKENKQFQYYARGSHSETITWLTKAQGRQLIADEKYEQLMLKMEELGRRHNKYIQSIGLKKEMTND